MQAPTDQAQLLRKQPKYQRPVWQKKPTIFTRVGKVLAIAAIFFLVLFPFMVVVSTSLSTQAAVTRAGGFVVWPTDVSLRAYELILSGGIVARALMISIGITAVGTTLSTVLTTMAAYGLSRSGSLWHKPLLMVVLFTFLFAPSMIPVYLTIKQLGMLNSWAALIIPGCVDAFNLVIVRNFFMNLPKELIEAARMDGASEWKIFRTIMLPLSKSVIAVIALFYGVGYWNSFFNAMLYLSDSTKWPLQMILRNYVIQGNPLVVDPNVKSRPPTQAIEMATIVIAIVPVLCVYPFVQKHLTKGVLTGAVKG